MIRSLIPLVMIVVAVGIFFGPTRSVLNATEPLTNQRVDLEHALESAQKIQSVRESLQTTYNSFKSSDLSRLQKLVSSHVDNVRLVIDINNMAATYGMFLRNIEVEQVADLISNASAGTIMSDNPEHLDIHFTVSGSYESLKLFLDDLGKSLRLVDITDLSFVAKDINLYDYSVNIRTYWLQDK
ncbi:MAG TPA: type 4a pilus biogenesis protein PilO [Candidatus Paceibacterota bacterium]